MKILTKMLAKNVLVATSFVLLALVALFAFFDLIGQASNIGTTYTLLQAFVLTALVLPTRCYEVLPIAAMLGAVYTLAKLAANSEFTVMRVAGLSPWRLCSMLLLPGVILVGLAYFMGEYVAPPAERLSKEVKLNATGSEFRGGRGFSSGVWVRDVQRNDQGEVLSSRFVNVASIRPGEAAFNWVIYIFDPQDQLTSIIRAERGLFTEGKGWVLYNVKEKKIPTLSPEFRGTTDAAVEEQQLPELVWGKGLDGNIFGLMMVKPEDMSIQDLYHYVAHLNANLQQSRQYEVALWTKLFYPLAILVMLALSMPFAYLNARSGGIAIKIFGGVMIGIAFYALNNLFSFMSILSTTPPVLAAVTPSLLMLCCAMVAMWFVERR